MLLAGAIITEVIGTLSLRATVDHPAWIGLVAAAYLTAFVLLGLTLRTGMAIGVAYGIWGACGVALVALLGAVLFGESLSIPAIAGIAVITATGSDGPVGFAASSFAGLSAEPPLVSFNIGRASSSLPTFLETETAMVHLLGDAHSPLVQRFAGPAASRFADDGAWSIAETGEPVLHAVRARLRVSLDRMIEAGDHLLVIAGLLDLEVIEPDEAPLVHTGGAVVTAGP